MPAEDLADGLARHLETLGYRAHRDAFDEAEAQHLGARGRHTVCYAGAPCVNVK